MPTTKEELNKLNEEPYVRPVLHNDMSCLAGETLMIYDNCKWNGKEYKPFYGIGVVYRVVKGEKQDLVYIRFGCFPNIKVRVMFCYENHARRQILTLKRGQVCQVWGICRYYQSDIWLNGVKTKGIKLGLFPKGINGWYTPTMMDIRKMPDNEDIQEPTDKEVDLQKRFESILDEFLNEEG